MMNRRVWILVLTVAFLFALLIWKLQELQL